MGSHFLNQLRVLFPRWNFFDQLGHRFHVKYKTSDSKNWILIEFKSHFSLLNFFCNSAHNLTLAQITAIELLAQDVQNYQHEKISDLSSFQIVKSLVQHQAKTHTFQFVIEAHHEEAITTLYTSPWINEAKA